MATLIPVTKLIILATLGFFALVMGSIVLTFQLRIIQERKRRGLFGQRNNNNGMANKNGGSSNSKRNVNSNGNDSNTPPASNSGFLKRHTIKNSVPTGAYDIRLWNLFPAPEGGNYKTIGEAYWRQVQAFLRDWKDAAVYPPDPTDYHSYTTDWMVRKSSEYRAGSHSNNNKTSSSGNDEDAFHSYPRHALERAADAGHPMAQHYLANAHASGIWPVPVMRGGKDEYMSSSADSLVENLHVFDEWLPTSSGGDDNHSRQIDKAYLLWHMAAVGGNIESAMALAHRLDESSSISDSSTSGNTCEDVLPYYQAAADGIIDQLEVSQNSRAKVIPFMDKHTLAQVHIHGGTSSQLDWNNKPDESKEALQFYHLKATTVPWSIKKTWNSDSENDTSQNKKGKKKKSSAEQEEGTDVGAAYTLAYLYRHGVRGVEQNLTKSLEYYEIAGTHGHSESAGVACMFHLWGIGTEQNAQTALDFCKIGAPFGYEGCSKMHTKADTAKNSKGAVDSGQILECDEVALNGLGLLHLMGIRGLLEVDIPTAEKYFTLAKEQGSADAYYNLAMMWLGWKTHFKTIDELKENGFTSLVNDGATVLPHSGQSKRKDVNEKYVLYKAAVGDDVYFKGPIQSDVQNAIKMLKVASKLGHLQARHRLALIYAQGLSHTTSVIQFDFVKPDCKKAKDFFQWIIENASPTLSERLRRAYKEYIAGNLEASVRNYLAAAEIGSIVGQVNAAFLMERGVCLGLGAADCAKASVRLWKVAAARGNAEACLRVGDFYYYGRLHGEKLYTGPFGWIQYILIPEKYLPTLVREWGMELLTLVRNYLDRDENSQPLKSSSSTCQADESTCRIDDEFGGATTTLKHGNLHDEMEEDLHNAAHYYQMAGEKHQSARANFNLGFMHQWGIGLKQDFPMAKRHYDLALSRNKPEAEIAVQIALIAMNTHEFAIRCKVLIEEWWYKHEASATGNSNTLPNTKKTYSPSSNSVPRDQRTGSEPAQSQKPGHNNKKTQEEVIMSHLFDQSSLIIVILFLLLLVMQVIMSFLGRPNRQ
jgi:SEL1 protein